jgi:hypothetical protein
MKKSLLNLFLLIMVSPAFAARSEIVRYEITDPGWAVKCIETHVKNRVVAPAEVRWEQKVSFHQKYQYISGTFTNPATGDYGIAFMWTRPKDAMTCTYETVFENGVANARQEILPGICTANKTDVELKYVYSRIDPKGDKFDLEQKFARVIDNKIYCVDFP